MKFFVISLLVFLSAQVSAQDIAVDDISLTIDEMVKNNIISSDEAKRAKFQLKNSQKAFLGATNRMPASVQSQLIESSHSTDLSKIQIKEIEKDVDEIFRRVMDK